MYFKIDTKEKFHAITFFITEITDTIAVELCNEWKKHLTIEIKNIVIDFAPITEIAHEAWKSLAQAQIHFIENNATMIMFNLSKTLEQDLKNTAYHDILNIAPTETEAWDIVHMDELLREITEE